MSIVLIVLDLLMYNFTPYNMHLVVLSIPALNNFVSILIYFLILSFFDYHYLFNLFVLFILYKVNRKVRSIFGNTATVYVLELIFTYVIYIALSMLFAFICRKYGF